MTLPGPKPGRYWGDGDFNALRNTIETEQASLDGTQTDVTTLQGEVAALQTLVAVPVGSVLPYAGAAAPAGFLLCNGQSVLRADYADLFAVVGTTYGAVDGTHFTVPDLRSRLPVGAGQGTGLTNRALAATGGEESHTLSAAESGLPAHTHTVTAAPFGGASQGLVGAGGYWLFNGAAAVDAQANATAAASSAHNTMPPFLALNWIIAV